MPSKKKIAILVGKDLEDMEVMYPLYRLIVEKMESGCTSPDLLDNLVP